MPPKRILQPSPRPATFQELRGPSGRLYGYIDLDRMIFEVKRKGEPPEVIDLKALTIKARNNPTS